MATTMYVYMMASASRVLYIGVTNDLRRRVFAHKSGEIPGFTRRYKVNRLVYFESTPNAAAAISREKELKAWRREKKLKLVETANPEWLDLAADSFPGPRADPSG